MTCPNCGRPLSLLEETLAATETGSECRNCWTFLRGVKPAPRRASVTTLRPLRHARSLERLRRAA